MKLTFFFFLEDMIKGLLIPCHSGQCSLIIFLTVPAQTTCKISFSVDVSDGKTTNIKISSPVAVEQLFRLGSLASFSRNIGCTYRLNSGIPDQVQEKIRGEVDHVLFQHMKLFLSRLFHSFVQFLSYSSCNFLGRPSTCSSNVGKFFARWERDLCYQLR